MMDAAKFDMGKIEEVEFWRDCIAARGAKYGYRFVEKIDPKAEVSGVIVGLVNEDQRRNRGDEVRILDVGAGPLTAVGKMWTDGATPVVIHAVDPLATEYAEILAANGIAPIVKTEFAFAEDLIASPSVKPPYDVVYSENALDHCASPMKAIRSILAVTKPGGAALIYVMPNEGEHQKYAGLHQWNFDVRDGALFLWRPDPKDEIDVALALRDMADVSACIDTPFGPETLFVKIVLRKKFRKPKRGRSN